MTKALFPDVIVNGVTIASAAIAAEAQNHNAPKNKPGLAWRQAARALIVREVLLQEAGKLGVVETPRSMGDGLVETQEEALIRGVIDASIKVGSPNDDEVRAIWSRDPDRYRAPPLWEVSHILVAADPSDEAARGKALTKAAALTEQVLADPKCFGRIAKNDSDCSSSQNGGLLGQLSPGDTVPEFEAALRDLSEGEITADPVSSRFGFHIVRKDAVAEGAVLPFDAVAPKLRAAMEKNAWVHEVQALTQRLTEAAEIVGIDLKAF